MWDERFSDDSYFYGTQPNDFLKYNFHTIPQGEVLCLAEGEGRNAVFLAEQGYQVTAVDSSAVGLKKARQLATDRGVQIKTIEADLAEFDPGQQRWSGIVSIFCHLPPDIRRQLHGRLAEALLPGGVLLLEAYTPAQLQFKTGGPPVADMMMSREILKEEISGLSFRHLQETERDVIEGIGHTGHAAVVQAIATRDNRRFAVSANRGKAVHKMRYVESGGGEASGDCRLCVPMVTDDSTETDKD
ncbi:SAM-dependent methyltransferase [Pseudohongiella spirulinae]|uniref:Methyltransferase type 11 n=1 Tax=Pseudohongiella spirulinae TaxID=1249552 RepID=A0A0S2KCL4_9GAMM|nr:Methyltransferase type 11 [Pseudohongiella spirulinae]